MPVAYLSPSLLQDLTNVSVSPGAGNTGYPMVWNNTSGRFELAVLGVAGGGTGTSNGSITGTGALTFAAGGTNQNITLTPSGSGAVVLGSTTATRLQINSYLPATPLLFLNQQSPWDGGNFSLQVSGYSFLGGLRINGADGVNGLYNASGILGFSVSGTNDIVFSSNNGAQRLLTLKGDGNVGIGIDSPGSPLHIATQVAATSTTTGSLRVGGGVGVTGSIYVGESLFVSGATAGSKVNFANLPTADTGLNSGDLWRDSNGFLRIV